MAPGARPMGRDDFKRLVNSFVTSDRTKPLFRKSVDDDALMELDSILEEREIEPANDVMKLYGKILYIKRRDMVVVPVGAKSLDMIECYVLRSREVLRSGPKLDIPKATVLEGVELGIHLPDDEVIERTAPRKRAKG